MKKSNPFIAGPIVEYKKFVGRQKEIDSLLSSFDNRLSVCIIGEPHIGKSSLLHYIKNHQIESDTRQRQIFVFRDGMNLNGQNSPAKFWQSVLKEVITKIDDKELIDYLKIKIGSIPKATENIQYALEKLIENEITLVLLLDELDAMVADAGLADISFWGSFRYLASARTFCFLGASRNDLFALNKILNEAINNKVSTFRELGSPIFNIAETIYLKPFSEEETNQLFSLTSAESKFNTLDLKIIKNLAGGHPYILQKAGDQLWKQKVADENVDYQYFVESLLENTDDHFKDTWKQLEAKSGSRTLAAMITLRELRRKTHNITTLSDNINMYSQAAQALERAGMIVKSNGNLELAGSLFAFWIQRNIISQPIDNLDEYLKEKEVKLGNITKEQQGNVVKVISQTYQEIKSIVTDISTAFIKSQLGL